MGDEWAVKQLTRDLEVFGYSSMTLKGDNEPALIELMEKLKRRRVQDTTLSIRRPGTRSRTAWSRKGCKT